MIAYSIYASIREMYMCLCDIWRPIRYGLSLLNRVRRYALRSYPTSGFISGRVLECIDLIDAYVSLIVLLLYHSMRRLPIWKAKVAAKRCLPMLRRGKGVLTWFWQLALRTSGFVLYTVLSTCVSSYYDSHLRLQIERLRELFIYNLVMKNNVKHAFLNLRFQPEVKEQQINHSHPNLATDRNEASNVMSKFARDIGLIRYDVSKSSRDKNSLGSHSYHCTKDLARSVVHDKVPENSLITMIDVDYYLEDLPVYALGKSMLLYTFNPRSLSGGDEEFRWRFVAPGMVEMIVNGGETYRHIIYNYDVSHLSIPTILGHYSYHVEKVKSPQMDHQYVLLTPFAWTFDPFRLIEDRQFRLPYPAMQVGPYLHMIKLEQTLRRCILKIGDWSQSEVDQTVFESIRIDHQASGIKNISSVSRFFDVTKCNREDIQTDSTRIFDCLKYMGKEPTVITGCANPALYDSVREVDIFDPNHPNKEGQNHSQATLPKPLVTNAGVTIRTSRIADKETVEMRVSEVRNMTVPPKQYLSYAQEFADLIIGDIRIIPKPMHEVLDNQSKPLQRKRIQEHTVVKINDDVTVSAFQKNEVYGKVGPPRNISQVDIDHTLELSMYTYAFKETFLKGVRDFYSPGQDPERLTENLMAYAQRHTKDGLLSTDFSKFDGTISEWLRVNVEQRCYLRAYNHDKKLEKLLVGETKSKARTRCGVTYEPGAGRLSGSPLTTDGNTLINAFVAFAAWRKKFSTKEPGFSLWNVGPKAGDDSIESAVIQAQLQEVCSDLGLKVKVDVIKPHEPVPYLGRYWVDPWTTSYSMQDLSRTLPKLSVSSNRQHTPEVALQNKICGYYVTDANTPLLGDICRCIAAKYEFDLNNIQIHHMIGADKDLLHKMQMGPYPQPSDAVDLALATAAKSLDTTPTDVLRAIERIREGELDTFFDNKVEDTTKFSYLVNGVLVPAVGKEGLPIKRLNIIDKNKTNERQQPKAQRAQSGKWQRPIRKRRPEATKQTTA